MTKIKTTIATQKITRFEPKTKTTPDVLKPPYPLQSEAAKEVWAKDELRLPKPKLNAEVLQPTFYLADILQFTRGAESRGEWLFREKWLKPYLKHFVAQDESNSTWEDAMGNIVVHVGGAACFDTLHVGHIDSVHSDTMTPIQEVDIRSMNKHGNSKFSEDREVFLKPIPKNSKPVIKTVPRWVDDIKIDHQYTDYELIKHTGGRSLGADDGCAVAIMMWMIQNQIAGTYMFTRGEERGCVGTKYMIEKGDLDFSQFKRAVEVDRKGEDEIIVKMSPGVTASDEFGKALATALGMGHKTSTKGSITDVGHLAKYIPECVNLAAGYYLQHSDRETVNVDYLNRLGKAIITVDWNALTSKRKAGEYYPPVNKNVNRNYHNNKHQNLYEHQSYSGTYASSKNKFGDYTKVDFTANDKPIMADYETEYQAAAFVRQNTGLISEFLSSLEITAREMHDICMFGLDGDINAYDPELDDEDPEKEFTNVPEEVVEKITDVQHTLELADDLTELEEALIAIDMEDDAEADKTLDEQAIGEALHRIGA